MILTRCLFFECTNDKAAVEAAAGVFCLLAATDAPAHVDVNRMESTRRVSTPHE